MNLKSSPSKRYQCAEFGDLIRLTCIYLNLYTVLGTVDAKSSDGDYEDDDRRWTLLRIFFLKTTKFANNCMTFLGMTKLIYMTTVRSRGIDRNAVRVLFLSRGSNPFPCIYAHRNQFSYLIRRMCTMTSTKIESKRRAIRTRYQSLLNTLIMLIETNV